MSSVGGETKISEELLACVDEFARSPDLEHVLRLAVEQLAELFDVERVSLVIFREDEDAGYVVLEHASAEFNAQMLQLADYPELREVIRRREPLVIPDVLGDALLAGVRSKLETAERPHRASLLFPLVRKDRAVGALFLRSRRVARRYEEASLAKGRLIAAVASISLGAAMEQDTLRREVRSLLRTKIATDRRVEDLQKYSRFFEQTHDGIVVTDNCGTIRYLNRAAESILRSDSASFETQAFVDLLAQDSVERAQAALHADDTGDRYIDLELQGDEPKTVISVAIRVLEDSDQRLISFRDVTELRRIEIELRQTRDFLENLIQSSVDAIVAARVSGEIILFNRSAERILGCRADETINIRNVEEFYPPEEYKNVIQLLRSDAMGGRGRLEPVRKELLACGGELVPVHLSAATIYENDREVAVVGIFTDLREKIRMEKKLSQAQKRLQISERQSVAIELAGAAAHELNQPLTSILGYAEMLKSRVAAGSPESKPVEVICQETERMAAIVRKIGELTAYRTQSYVGGANILDFD